VPYDAGFILVRDGTLHRNTFATSAPYLRRELRGLAAGAPWPCDFGPDLSRGFRALKTWFTLKVYGTAALGAAISRTCALARHLESRIAATPELELLAPVELNVVCFRYRSEGAQRINPRIAIELQESGAVAPSTTILDGRLAIRAAIVNHRTGEKELDLLVEKTVALGRAMEASAASSRAPGQALGADWPPQRAREEALRDVDARIAARMAARMVEDSSSLDAASAGPSVDPASVGPSVDPASVGPCVDPASADRLSVSLRFERAGLLAELGRSLEARNAYIDVLARDPAHRLALNNLGTLL
jgi:hypothetical protein